MTLARDYWASSSEPTEWADRRSCNARRVSLSVYAHHPARPEVPAAIGLNGRRRPPPL